MGLEWQRRVVELKWALPNWGIGGTIVRSLPAGGWVVQQHANWWGLSGGGWRRLLPAAAGSGAATAISS